MALFDRFRRRPEKEEIWDRLPDDPNYLGDYIGDYNPSRAAQSEQNGPMESGRPMTTPTEQTGPVGVGAFGAAPGGGMAGYEIAVNESLAQPVVGKDQIREALQILRKYMAGKANLDKRMIENEQWWKLRHWDQIPQQGTTGLKTKSAWLVNVILSKHADAMDALPEPNCLPRAADNKLEARKLSKILPLVLEQADFASAWSTNWWKKLKAGLGVYGVFWDKDALNGLGEIAIRPIDALKLYWEPGVLDIQDSANVFLISLEDNKRLEAKYPELKGKLNGKDLTVKEYLYDDHVDTSDKSPVVDWYYKRETGGRKVLHYVKFVGESVLYATENDGRVLNEAQIMQAEASGMEPPEPKRPTDCGLYDHGQYPFYPDVLFPEEGTPAGFGYVDLCKDAQRQIDLMNNAIVANCVAAATPRWLKRGEDGINEEEYADWTKPFVHVQGAIDEAAIRQITVSPLSGNYLAILESKIAEMKETSGNRDVNNGGAPSGVTAASAIAAMQEQSGKLSRDQIRTSYNCFKAVCYCAIELIRQFYDAPREFRIIGMDGQDMFVSYDNSRLQIQEQMNPYTQMMEIRKPVFDIKVTAQKATEYSKLSQNELALQFYQMGFFAPNNADPSLAALEMMDFDGKEDVRQRVQQNGTMFQMLQMVQAENMMLKARLGIAPMPGTESAGPGDGRQIAGATGGARLPETDSQGGIAGQNRIVEQARGKAQAATQPR
ncbi:MAG: hypothetical protein IKS05_00980 [Oscillospiraceae bacterium]|nr:hypothetical protein [Oscillospiraceae bacterium]